MESYLSPANYFTCTIQFLVFNLLSALGKASPVVKALYKFIYSFKLHDNDEDVFATSVIDRYAARPLALQNICLATFAVMYDVIKSSTQTEETEDVNTQEDMYNTENPETSTKIKLQKGLGVIRKRKQQAILHTRRYKVHREPEKYYHAKLLLYYPWNHEDDLISTYQSYQDSYI